MLTALLLALAPVSAPPTVGVFPAPYAEEICEGGYQAQVRGEDDYWPRLWSFMAKRGKALSDDEKADLLKFCIGYASGQRHILDAILEDN